MYEQVNIEPSEIAATTVSARPDRAALIAFLSDIQSEEAVREGLSDALQDPPDIRRGGIRAAITAMARIPTPRVLIVDIGDGEDPVKELAKLSEVVEPDVCVLVVGVMRDAESYRDITRGLGAAEYLCKPLTRDAVSRYFAPLVMGHRPVAMALGTGRLITVTGSCGGVGATTTAANFAWFLGTVMRRHTILLDPDLETGSLAFLLNVQPGTGLQAALSAPDRIDELFIERSVAPVSGRLHILANDEMPNQPIRADETASARLIGILRKKYTFVVADVPFRPDPLFRGLLHMADQRVIVMEPTLASVRRALRLLALPKAPGQARHPVIILNQLGMPGGLKRRQVEDALGIHTDIVIPYLPRLLMDTANLGEPAAAKRGAFRDAVIQLTQQLPFARLTPDSPHISGRKHWWQRTWRK